MSEPSTPAPVGAESDRLMEHEYDGIREYDNPLPGWWSAIFIATVIFAPIYFYWYHLGGPGKSEAQRFDAEWKDYVAWKTKAQAATDLVVDEDTLKAMTADPSVVAAGRELFVKNCVGCHTDNGGGNVGPNLTDDFQIHGATRLDVYATIRDGVPDKGMITWSQTMSPRDMATVASYVITLRGTNVAGGKAPQGAKVGAFQ